MSLGLGILHEIPDFHLYSTYFPCIVHGSSLKSHSGWKILAMARRRNCPEHGLHPAAPKAAKLEVSIVMGGVALIASNSWMIYFMDNRSINGLGVSPILGNHRIFVEGFRMILHGPHVATEWWNDGKRIRVRRCSKIVQTGQSFQHFSGW